MPIHRISLQEAVDHLYHTAIGSAAPTSTLRLQGLANYCIQELADRGLVGAGPEVTLPGGGRDKKWDVGWRHDAKYRLAISLKSILQNLPGTVPNRIDDMMGEVANAQMYSPELVLGYVMLFNVAADRARRSDGKTWCAFLTERLSALSGRSAPSWSVGMVEAFVVVQVDFSQSARLLTDEAEVHAMMDVLAAEVKRRNPSLLGAEAPR